MAEAIKEARKVLDYSCYRLQHARLCLMHQDAPKAGAKLNSVMHRRALLQGRCRWVLCSFLGMR